MITINLLPDVKQEFLRAKRTRGQVIGIATLVSIAMLGLVVLLAFWVYVGQALQINYYTTQIKQNGNKMVAIPELDKYLTLQNQLDNLDELHSSKSDFSRLMTYLPKLNPAAPNNVTLSDIEIKTSDEGNQLMMKGETKDYTALNIFRDTLKTAQLRYTDDENKLVTEQLFETVAVTTSALDKAQDGKSVVSFEIQIAYNPNAFLFSVKKPEVVVKDKDTTASVVASPDVFGKSTKQEEAEQ